MRSWNIKHSIEILLAVRDQIGPFYGSEDLAMLLYSLVRREKPARIVELGTGCGASTIWMAAALRENGHGRILTVDNGSLFLGEAQRAAFERLSGPLYDLARMSETCGYEQCMRWIFEAADLEEVIKFEIRDIDFSAEEVSRVSGDEPIDLLFSDFNHGPATILHMLAAYLPYMAENSSIYIDSASTYMPSNWMLESLVRALNEGKVPATLLRLVHEEKREIVLKTVRRSNFQLIHLMEKSDRSQNSTSLIRISAADIFPPIATGVRLPEGAYSIAR